MLLLYCNTVDWGIPPGRHSNTIGKETPHLKKKKLLKAKISDRLLWQFFSDSFARGFDLNLSEDAELSLTLNPKYLTIVSLMTLFTFSLQNLSVALAMSQLNKILFSTFSVFLKVQNLQKFSLMLRKCSQVFLKFFKGNHFDPSSTTRLKCNNYMSSFQMSSSSNIIIIFKYHQNWRGFWLSWGDPGESVLLRSRLPETPVHSSLYHHHQYHSIIIIIIITLSPSSIVHQFIKIIIRITSFCMSITITP